VLIELFDALVALEDRPVGIAHGKAPKAPIELVEIARSEAAASKPIARDRPRGSKPCARARVGSPRTRRRSARRSVVHRDTSGLLGRNASWSPLQRSGAFS
jgi:hypothetical protein